MDYYTANGIGGWEPACTHILPEFISRQINTKCCFGENSTFYETSSFAAVFTVP